MDEIDAAAPPRASHPKPKWPWFCAAQWLEPQVVQVERHWETFGHAGQRCKRYVALGGRQMATIAGSKKLHHSVSQAPPANIIGSRGSSARARGREGARARGREGARARSIALRCKRRHKESYNNLWLQSMSQETNQSGAHSFAILAAANSLTAQRFNRHDKPVYRDRPCPVRTRRDKAPRRAPPLRRRASSPRAPAPRRSSPAPSPPAPRTRRRSVAAAHPVPGSAHPAPCRSAR